MSRKSKNTLAIALGAAGAGAGLMFLLDPDRGGRRRKFIGGTALHLAKFLGGRVARGSQDLGNRVGGLAETRGRRAQERAPDGVLAERVRSKIGRVVTHPRAIDVTAERGMVELRGAVLRSERRRAIRVAESVQGVRAVHYDALMTYSDEQLAPGLQPRSRPRDLKQAKPPGKLRALRLGLALASGVVAGYRAFQGGGGPRQRRSEAASKNSSDIAA